MLFILKGSNLPSLRGLCRNWCAFPMLDADGAPDAETSLPRGKGKGRERGVRLGTAEFI